MPQPTSKPRVFVSSTISDFKDLRSALKFWLEEMGLEVQMNEFNDFQRRPDQGTFNSCFSAIEDCDYYVLLVGGRRGSWFNEEEKVSVTQQEYRIAVALANKGKIKPVIFIRDQVMTALNEGKALRDESADPTAIHGGPSSILKDPEFVASFIEEIEQTQLDRGGALGPAGFVWHYRFGDFEDIVSALQVNLNLHRSIHRQALLANLKWEIEENVATLCLKHRGVPLPHTRYLSAICKSTRLTPQNLRGTFPFRYDDANKILVFWLFLPQAARFKVSALAQAVFSGEFLCYDQKTRRLVPGEVYTAMQHLLGAIRRYRGLVEVLQQRTPQRESLLAAVKEKQQQVGIDAYDVEFLFAVHDVLENVLQLSVALLRWILDPASEFKGPTLNPVSPIEGETERIRAECATHLEVEQWARDACLLGLASGERAATTRDVEAAMERYPAMKDLLEPIIQSWAEEFTRRVRSEGVQAAIAWLLSRPARDS